MEYVVHTIRNIVLISNYEVQPEFDRRVGILDNRLTLYVGYLLIAVGYL
jgi:hypothetical protein